jgi:hypothetical protein
VLNILAILLRLWLLGFLAVLVGSSLIPLLPLVAVVVLIINLVTVGREQGRNPAV